MGKMPVEGHEAVISSGEEGVLQTTGEVDAIVGAAPVGILEADAVIFGRRVHFPAPDPAPQLESHRVDRAASSARGRIRALAIEALPSIDISIVTYRSEKWIARFVESLVEQNYPLDKLELFFTDHSPDDTCAETLRKALASVHSRFRGVHIVRRRNRGFGAGHNEILTAGSSPLILVTNIDLTFAPDTLCALVDEALTDSGHTAAFECFQKPYEHPKIYNAATGETPWSSSACVLFRRRALEEVGGYDERFFMYGEDVDLSFRLRDCGWVLKYCPRAVVWHYTYEYAGQVKEVQFFGDTLANMYLRLRYAPAAVVLRGIVEYANLLFHSHGFPRERGKLMLNWWKLILNAPHFLASRKASGRAFLFGKSGYAPHRLGGFYRFEPLPPRETCPLVSVVVRSYPGRAPLLREALLSISNQTYRPVEIIVVEDGGRTCRDTVHELRSQTDIEIVYYASEKVGRCVAGNLGLALSRGAFLCFLDDDDQFFADHLEVLTEALRKAPEAPAACSYGWEVRTAYPSHGWVPYRAEEPQQTLHQPFERTQLWSSNFMPIQSVLFRRQLFETFGGFCPAVEQREDWELWQRYSLAGDFVTVEKTTSLYRTPAGIVERHQRAMAMAIGEERIWERQRHMGAYYSLSELREEMAHYAEIRHPFWQIVHYRAMRRLQNRPLMRQAYLLGHRARGKAIAVLRTILARE